MRERSVLIMNVGSTSCKIKQYLLPGLRECISMRFAGIGGEKPCEYVVKENGKSQSGQEASVRTYGDAIRFFLGRANVRGVAAVGFKTVLSMRAEGVAELTDEIIADMRALSGVCPAHNPPYADAIEQCRAAMPQVPMIGSFETGFHRTIPLHNRIYGLPYEWYEKYGVRKNGFHGASHEYASSYAVSRGYQKVICCHLGGSSSVCAVSDGKSLDISFGFSPQSGVMQLYRAGDTDCAIVPWLRQCGLTQSEIEKGFSVNGGLRGIAGINGDMRDLLADESPRARLAVDAYVASVVRYIGAFYAELGGLDAITFSGGIGENSPSIREKIVRAVAHLGANLDEKKNAENAEVISTDYSPVKVFVVPADEERIVAQKVVSFLKL